MVTSIKNRDTATTVTIPNTYKNLPVTGIGESAFSSCELLTSVTIGNSVTSIGYNAFSYCISLTNVVIGNNVKTIDRYAFSGCYSLSDVEFKNTMGWYVEEYYNSNISIASVDLQDKFKAAKYLNEVYCSTGTWKRNG